MLRSKEGKEKLKSTNISWHNVNVLHLSLMGKECGRK